MKKLIALMMCAMLLLSGCAAVTAEGPGVGLQVSDLVLAAGGETALDLTGLTAAIETAKLDTGAGVRIRFTADGQEPADVILATVGQYLYLSLPGDQGPNNYAFDMAKALQAVSDAYDTIIGAIVGIIPAIFTGQDDPAAPAAAWSESGMTDEELEAALAELEAAIAEMEAAGGDDYAPEAEDGEAFASVPVMTEADEAMEAKLNEILSRCVTQQSQQIDGEDFQVITVNFTEADMAELLDAIPLNDLTGVTLGQYLASSGTGISLEGTVTGNNDFSKFTIDGGYTITVEDESIGLNVVADNMDGDDVISASLALLAGGQQAAELSLAIGAVAAEDAGWLPGELPVDTTVLTDLSVNGAGDALEDGLDSFGTVLGNMLGAVAQANQGG